jgi:hypothetical protein
MLFSYIHFEYGKREALEPKNLGSLLQEMTGFRPELLLLPLWV